MATYVTSDLHGYPFEQFMDFLARSGFGDNDTLWILGDVADRGNDGVRYLWWASSTPNVKMIMGNHEKMLLDCEPALDYIKTGTLNRAPFELNQRLSHWLSNGGNHTLDVIERVLGVAPARVDEIFDFIRFLPLYAELTVNGRDFVLVHGGLSGFSPERPMSDYQAFDLLWCRPAPMKRYFEDKTVILGHTPTECYGCGGRMYSTDTWLDIDTGAGHHGAPMLLRLDDMREFYIDAT